MPTVFLSYSHENLDRVSRLAQELAAQKIGDVKVSVWRDKTNLHAGQLWPKRLGEAIAESDFFLLAWSKSAALSHFVELEWNTAIALKKVIILYLLDSTPRPAFLEGVHGIDAGEPAQAISQILDALRTEQPGVDPAHHRAVIDKLSDITSTEPKEVVRAARAIFKQQEWTVQGNVYQAAGDIHIIHTPQQTEKADKSFVEKWQTWVALVVAVLTAIGLAADLPGKLGFSVFSDTDEVLDQPLAGWIRDMETELPIAGVEVTLQYSGGITVPTNKDGHFSFPPVHAPKQETVTLMVKKEEYETLSRQFFLGNTKIRIPLKKTRK